MTDQTETPFVIRHLTQNELDFIRPRLAHWGIPETPGALALLSYIADSGYQRGVSRTADVARNIMQKVGVPI